MADDAASDARPVADTGSAAEPGERGTLVIADKVIEKLATGAASEVDRTVSTGSGFARSLLPGSTARLPSADAEVAGGRARIGLRVAAPWPSPAGSVAAAVRDHVRTRVALLSGLQVDAVDVTVADLVQVTESPRRLR